MSLSSDSLAAFLTRAENAEAEIKSLENQIRDLQSGTLCEDLITPELAKLKTENSKLKYQIKHLEKNVEKEEFQSQTQSKATTEPQSQVSAAAQNGQHMTRKGLMEKIESCGIKTITVEHPEVFTVEEMMPHVGHLPGAHTKNLFMKDKKKKGLWLLSARHDVDVNLGTLSKKVNAPGGLRFADESVLQEKLGVRQGCVTAFALVNDQKHEVKFIVDEDLVNGKFEQIHFHPLTNAATTGISPKDFLAFLKATGHEPIKVKLP